MFRKRQNHVHKHKKKHTSLYNQYISTQNLKLCKAYEKKKKITSSQIFRYLNTKTDNK